jgi:hypothetical protein
MPAYGQLQQQAVELEKYLLYSKVFSARHDKKQRAREESEEDGGKKETKV